MNIVLTNDAQKIAGGENYVLYLAEGLRAKGHNVSIAPMQGSELAAESVKRKFPTYEIPYGEKGKEFNAIRIFYQKVKHANPHIVHSNSNFDRTIAAFAGKLMGAKNITTIHSCLSIRRNPVHAYRNRFLIDHFTPVGHSTKKIMTETDKIDESRISVVHIGLPAEKILFNPGGRKKIRGEFNIPDEVVLFGTLSRLVDFKGHTYLLQAAQKLIEANTNFKIMIVGEGDLEKNLKLESAERRLTDKVIFTGHRSDIQDILSSFDVIVQSSKDFGGETFPVSLLEAMSVGVAILASDVGDIRYMLDNNVNGILLNPTNVNQLADAMNSLSSDSNLVRLMGENSRKKFLNEFTLDKMVDSIEHIYKSLTN